MLNRITMTNKPAESELIAPDESSDQLDGLRASIKMEIREAEKGLTHFFRHAIKAGRYLCRVKAMLPHGRWLDWFEASEFGFSERTAQRYMKAYEQRSELRELIRDRQAKGDLISLNQALTLLANPNVGEPSPVNVDTTHDIEDRDSISVSESGSRVEVGASDVSEAVGNEIARVISTEPFVMAEDWQTPQHLATAVEAMLGVIDLDPCSDGEVSRIAASKRYTKEEDGLDAAKPWEGRLFVNPPLSRAAAFVERLKAEVRERQVGEAILLVPAVTDAPWFRTLKPFMRAFIARPDISLATTPDSLVAIYIGQRHQRFAEQFQPIGDVYCYYGFRAE